MTTKEWLMRAWNIDKEIKALLAVRDEAFRQCTAITSKINDMRVSSSGTLRKDTMLIRLAEFDEALKKKVDELIQTKQEILRAISLVNDTRYRTLLYLRYILHKTWEEIAVEMNYSFRNVTYMHGKALKEIRLPSISH